MNLTKIRKELKLVKFHRKQVEVHERHIIAAQERRDTLIKECLLKGGLLRKVSWQLDYRTDVSHAGYLLVPTDCDSPAAIERMAEILVHWTTVCVYKSKSGEVFVKLNVEAHTSPGICITTTSLGALKRFVAASQLDCRAAPSLRKKVNALMNEANIINKFIGDIEA